MPAPTWAFAITMTCRTVPENGAVMAISIFIDSSTARRSPAATWSPGLTLTPTTIAGPGARTMPASAREMR